MNRISVVVRSIIFFVFFVISTIILFVFLLVSSVFKNKKYIRNVALVWTKITIYSLKIICKLEYKVEGLENLPKDSDGNYILVSKHQSTWETYFLYYFFENSASFVLKKELLNVPVIGYGLKRTGHIAIDRDGGASTMKKTIQEAKHIIEKENRKIVIFPQGTRVPIGKNTDEYPYKSGFLGIVKTLKLDMVPIALNTGCFWSKKSFLKKPGTIVVKFLPVIKYKQISDLKKEEVIQMVENVIETESNKLVNL